MLYKIAHMLRDKFGFLWKLVELLNALVFSMRYAKSIKRIPEVLARVSDTYSIRLANMQDAEVLAKFFAEQPEESFNFFKPHAFDKASLSGVLRSKSYLAFLVYSGDAVVGYFFLRCFANGKCFRGKIVDYRWQGKGIAKLMGKTMTDVAISLPIRMFGTISPDNYASLASSKSVNEVKILSTLDNGYYYIEYLPKE